jgi:predicted transcriptional regulator
MGEAKTTLKRLREEFDEKCEQIVDIMLIRNAFESDKLRYNELYRIVSKTVEMTKPTFNEHIEHLKQKKVIKRKKVGKQKVYLFLNTDNLMVEKARQIKKEMDEELVLLDDTKKSCSWSDLLVLLSHYFAICELRETKLILNYILSPQKQRENVLAIAFQAKRMDVLRFGIISSLKNAINRIESSEEKEDAIQRLMNLLDKAIEHAEEQLLKPVNKLE